MLKRCAETAASGVANIQSHRGDRPALLSCGLNVCGSSWLNIVPSKLFYHLQDWLKLWMSLSFLLVILLLSTEN